MTNPQSALYNNCMPTSPTRPTFLSLPDEVLALVGYYCDTSTALALARVHRRVTKLADHGIWRTLSLTIADRHDYTRKNVQKAKRVERDMRWDIKTKVEEVVKRADVRRMGMVRELVITTRPGCRPGIFQILALVAPTLRSLTIEAPRSHVLESHWRPHISDTFDVDWFKHDLAFPSLRSLTIGKSVLRFAEFGPYLFGLAPNLASLTIDAHEDRTSHAPEAEALKPSYPLPKPHNSIQELRIAQRVTETDFSTDEIVSILRLLPNVRRLSIDCPVKLVSSPDDMNQLSDMEYSLRGFVKDLSQLESIEELEWHIDPDDFYDALGASGGFTTLRRLALGPHWSYESTFTPTLPNLEMIVYSGPLPAITPLNPSSDITLTSRSAEDLFSSFHKCPRLHFIHKLPFDTSGVGLGVLAHIDTISDDGDSIGFRTSSIRYGDKELLYVRYRSSADADWKNLASYQGKVVPTEVVEKMRVGDGASEADWQGRGVEVGEDAWVVFTEWLDTV